MIRWYYLSQNYLLWIIHHLHFRVPCPGFLHNHQFRLVNHHNYEYSHWYHHSSLPYAKNMEVFFKTSFLTASRIVYFIILEVSGVFFLLSLCVIQIISGVIPDISSPCPEKSERYLLSLRISIYAGVSILLLILDKLVL